MADRAHKSSLEHESYVPHSGIDCDSEKEHMLLLEDSRDHRAITKKTKILSVATAVAGISLLLYIAWQSQWWKCNCDQKTSSWLAGVDRSFHPTTFNKFEDFNVFTSPAQAMNDTAEEKWMDLGVYAASMILPLTYGKELGFDPEKHVIADPKDNPHYPYKGYWVTMQVLHQLHCVNLLRQGLYYNYQHYRNVHSISWGTSQSDTIMKKHLAHCIDTMRQLIMCEVDVRLTPYLRGPSNKPEDLIADFAQEKQCRNFESARAFGVEHQWRRKGGRRVDDDHTEFVLTSPAQWPIDRLWSGH